MRPALLAVLLALIPSLLFAADPPVAPAPLFDDNGTPLTIAQFVEKYIPDDMPEGLGRKEVQAALEDAGANWVELATCIFAVSPVNPQVVARHAMSGEPGQLQKEDDFQNGLWLICNAPHLDRLELNHGIVTYAIGIGLRAAIMFGYDQRSDLFRRYVLNYRFEDEPCVEWGYAFWQPVSMDAMLSGRVHIPDIVLVTNWAAKDFTIIERGYFGNLSDPVSLLHSRAGTKRELSILVAAALRSQGYATRFVRENRSGESWVEVYSGDPKAYDAQAWTPVYPTAPDKTGDVGYATELCGGRICVVTAGDAFGREQVTKRYTQTGEVSFQFHRWSGKREGSFDDSHEFDDDFSSFAITAWNDAVGGYVPLDDLEYPSGDKDYPLDEPQPWGGTPDFHLGPGEYRVEWGVRYPDGITHVQCYPFEIEAGNGSMTYLPLDPPADLPQTALVERDLGDFAESNRLMKRGRYVFLVGNGGEPSLRAYELLKPLESRSSVFFQHWRVVGATDEDRAFVKDVLKVDVENDPLPVVIVVVDGKTTMYLRGYNLNVAQWVERALEADNVE